MNCPYCAENVNQGATVCKTCRRDIGLVLSLQEKNYALEERIQELEGQLAAGPAALAAEPVVEEPPKKPGILDIVGMYLILPMLLLIGAHYLLIIKIDSKWSLPLLRAASIVLPAIFGLLLDRRLRPRWFVTFGLGLIVAFVAILGMSTIVHFTDGNPILPEGPTDWRETLEYVTSISLSYLLGALLARAARPIRLTPARRGGTAGKLATFLAKHVTGKPGEPLDQRIQRMVKLIQLGVSASTAIGAVYTGFKSIL